MHFTITAEGRAFKRSALYMFSDCLHPHPVGGAMQMLLLIA